MNTYRMPKILLIAAVLLMAFGLLTLWSTNATAAPTASPGDIVINEIMKNPEAPLTDNNEWFEIVNLTGSNIDINGWVIASAAPLNHTISGAPVVAPGDYYLICANGDPAGDGSITCDHTAGTNFDGLNLGNLNSSVRLVESGIIITQIVYDTTNWPNDPARSMEFSVPNGGAGAAAENNVSTNWASASNTAPFEFAAGNYGTPGTINRDWNPTAVTFSQQGIANPSTLASVVFLVLGLLAATTAVFLRRQQA